MNKILLAAALVCGITAAEDVKYLNPPKLGAPVARFSHAVVVPAGANMIFVSGQGGSATADIVGQTKETMENLKIALEAAGSDFAHVVKMNIYLTDMSRMPELRKVRDAYLDPKRAPAMTTAKVAELVGGIKIEIDVVAVSSK